MHNILEQLTVVKQELAKLEKLLLAGAAPTEPSVTLPWSDAPDWAQWAAMDADGIWYWYLAEPVPLDECWINTAHSIYNSFSHQSVPDWKTSKQRRP